MLWLFLPNRKLTLWNSQLILGSCVWFRWNISLCITSLCSSSWVSRDGHANCPLVWNTSSARPLLLLIFLHRLHAAHGRSGGSVLLADGGGLSGHGAAAVGGLTEQPEGWKKAEHPDDQRSAESCCGGRLRPVSVWEGEMIQIYHLNFTQKQTHIVPGGMTVYIVASEDMKWWFFFQSGLS